MAEQEELICFNGNGGKEKMDVTGSCDPYRLLKFFCGLPDEKKRIIRGLGFAPLVDMPAHHIRGVVVRWMVEQYDTVVDKVNMNGCMLSITSRDVEDLLGFKDAGDEVDDYGFMEDIEGIRQRYGKMTKKELEKGIVDTSIDGPAELNFKCMVVLYVLQVYLCPTTHRTPKRFMLHIVKQIEKKLNLNWAKFLLLKLKSGIGNYKLGKKKIVEGCTHLLMVFYLERSGGLSGEGKLPSWESWTEKRVQTKVYQDLFFLQKRPSTTRVAKNGCECILQRDVVEMRREIGEMKILLNRVLEEVKGIREEMCMDRDKAESEHRMDSPCTVAEEGNESKGLTQCEGDTSELGSMQEKEGNKEGVRGDGDESLVAELLNNIKHQFPKDVLTLRDAPIWESWKRKKSRFGETQKECVGGVAKGRGKGKLKGKRKRRDDEDRGVDDVEREEEELRKALEGKSFGGEALATENIEEDDPGHATLMAMAKLVGKHEFDANDMPTPFRAIEGLVKRCNFKSEESNLFKYVFNSIGYPDSDILFSHPRMYEKVERQTFRRYYPNRWLASPAVDCNACLLNDEAKNDGDKWIYLPSLISLGVHGEGAVPTEAGFAYLMDKYVVKKFMPECCGETQLIFLPMIADGHWSLGIVDLDARKVFNIDSARMTDRAERLRTTVKFLAEYCQNSKHYKRLGDMRSFDIVNVEGPRQKNGDDCGFFTLKYMWAKGGWRDLGEDDFKDIPELRLQLLCKVLLGEGNKSLPDIQAATIDGRVIEDTSVLRRSQTLYS